MQKFSISPIQVVKSFWGNRNLIKAMVQRDVIGRYRGSRMGIFWSFFNPVLMLAVYTFVFSVVFKARWNTGGNETKAEFALVLFAGMIIFNLFSECINKSPTLILSNVNYVKKVIFPLEILPWVTLGSAILHAFISFLVWLIAYFFLVGTPHATIFLLPIVIFPLLLFILGVCWCLASIGVYLRDVSQFVGIITTVMMFLSPIFYPASALPENYRQILTINPLTPAVEQARDVMLWGEIPDINIFFVYLAFSALVFWCGFAWFQKTRRGFADVI